MTADFGNFVAKNDEKRKTKDEMNPALIDLKLFVLNLFKEVFIPNIRVLIYNFKFDKSSKNSSILFTHFSQAMISLSNPLITDICFGPKQITGGPRIVRILSSQGIILLPNCTKQELVLNT